MQEIGYIGLEYQGGIRLTGTMARGSGDHLHRVFILWDAPMVNRYKYDATRVIDDMVDDGLEKGIRAGSIYKY